MGLGTTSRTVAEVMTEVKRTFGDESAVQVNDADILRWINSAQREILVENRILKATGTTTVTAGVSEYSMDALNVVSIQSIHYKGRKLSFMTFNEAEEYIQQADPEKTNSGDPSIWYEWAGTINLYPVPDSTLIDGLVVYYIKEPTKVTKAADTLSVPDAYYENVVQYVLARSYELDEDSENSQFKLNQFQQRLDKLSDQDAIANQNTYPRITVLEEDM